MPATKHATRPDPVAALERLLPHEGSLRGRVSDADAAELAARLEDCSEEAGDYNAAVSGQSDTNPDTQRK